MKYYNNASCTSCKITKMMLDKYEIQVEEIDVSTIQGFKGLIPQLQLDSGQLLIGPHEIRSWIRQTQTLPKEQI
jgi:arsenate reductase-like glutaredoxin family protein